VLPRIGLVTALRRDGYRVFGTSRKPMPDTSDGITMLICDVIRRRRSRQCREADARDRRER
jgi:hypothetical protein